MWSYRATVVLKSPPTTASLSSATLTSVLPMLPETPDLKIPHLSEEGPKTPLLSPHDDEGENEDDDRTEHDADGRSINDPSDAPIVESATDNSFARLYDGVPSAAPLHR
ncbi:hypothetical protein CALVIDRAFT_539897 [Calocera viscosa TUFC12733]|uniref:Uncharacterized protein n=1 Tax=Calocera viscosa (strain TUFC12733) TaxID=1330018 RepID=A0A167JCG6_CALVF|nr:hypothetical protein CALVIDRAFT_539897 [Calocera viscosa TUFC12733]